MIVTNLFTNPSFETASGTVTVRTNWITNPRMVNSTAGWSVSGTGVTQTPTASGSQLDFSSGVANGTAFFLPTTSVAAAAGDSWGSSIQATVPAGYPSVTVELMTCAYNGGSAIGSVPPVTSVTINAGQTVTLTCAPWVLPATTTGVRFYLYAIGTAIPAGARIILSNALLENSVTLGSYFDGTTVAAGDFTYAWAGTADASASYQNATSVANALSNGPTQGYGVRSADWAAADTKSLRVMQGSTGTGFCYIGSAGTTIPVVAGGFYTFVATGRMTAAQTGSGAADPHSRSIGARFPQGSELLQGPQLANSAGQSELRWTFQVPAGRTTMYATFWQGINVIGDVWWDSALLVAVPDAAHPYSGPAYDGSTTDTANTQYAWTGTADASTSTMLQYVTVTPDPTFTPPRNAITVQVTPGDVMKTVTLNRVVNSVPTPVRSQPSPGFDTQIVEDYESPYGVPVTYEAVVDYSTPPNTVVWDETWTNLTAWSGDTADYAVASGLLELNVVQSFPAVISQPVPSGSYRITVASMTVPGFYADDLASGIIIPGLVQVSPLAGGHLQIGVPGTALQATSILAGSPFTIDFLGTSIVITGTGGSYNMPGLASTDFTSVQIAGQVNSGGVFHVGEVKVSPYPATTHLDATSDPVTLAAANPWFVHPSNPALSVQVGSSDRSAVSIRTIGQVVNRSASTEHTILGQASPITTTSGPRYSDEVTVVLGSKTAAQEAAVVGLLTDGTPILFRAPPSFDTGFAEGFYSVGDMSRGRFAQRPGAPRRDITIPMNLVQAPIVNVQNTGWSWAALAAEFATWADVSAAFATWADVLTNNRRPGF